MAETFAGDLSILASQAHSPSAEGLNPLVKPESVGETFWQLANLVEYSAAAAELAPQFLTISPLFEPHEADTAIAPESSDRLTGQLHAPLQTDSLLVGQPAPSFNMSLTQAWETARTQLSQFLANPRFETAIATAFGSEVEAGAARQIVTDWTQGRSLPELEIVPSAVLQARGAFSAANQTVYLGQDLLAQNAQSAIAAVLLEELGHALDSQLNSVDAAGDEGAIFAALVQDEAIAPTDLAALKAENDHAVLHWQDRVWAVEQAALGEFTVGSSGEVGVEFVFDSGAYTGELAIFSLAGMETLTPGSTAYIKEAARRALSHSPTGYIVIADAEQGAQISGELGERNWNRGGYSGLQSVALTPGDTFGVMLVPDDSVQSVFDQPDRGGKHRPLFSIEAANPEGFIQMGQLANGLFAMEDLRRDRRSDSDFNDLIFKITGAAGQAVSVEALLPRRQDWQNTSIFKKILATADSAPSSPPSTPTIDPNSGNPTGAGDPSSNPGGAANPGGSTGGNPGGLPTTLLTSFADSLVKFDPAFSETAIAALNGSQISLGDKTIYIGTQQVGANNQNPIISLFDSANPLNNWTRTDYEVTGTDGRGIGLAWTGSDLYGIFTVDGTQGSASEDFRRASQDAQQIWLRSYGQGGGAKVSVIGRLDLATGELLDAAYLSALLNSGNSNTLVANNIAVNSAGNLVVSADSFFSPRRPDGSQMQQLTTSDSPFAYTVEILPNLKQVVSTQAVGWI
ncbi:MAG: DUF4114 domain-containing protein [Leptolyngbya sp. SIO4C5]|nr:DUF4114 domain-containing protein [Leptolyngbya sp. SIO4C5]